jgi:hypothetical protein
MFGERRFFLAGATHRSQELIIQLVTKTQGKASD